MCQLAVRSVMIVDINPSFEGLFQNTPTDRCLDPLGSCPNMIGIARKEPFSSPAHIQKRPS